MICHVWPFSSLQQFAECMCTRKTAAADDVQESLQFILLSMGYGLEYAWCIHGRDMVPQNQHWKPVSDAHAIYDEPPEEMPEFVFIPCGHQYSDWNATCWFVANTYIMLFWCRPANWWFQGCTLDKQHCFRVVCKELELTFTSKSATMCGCTAKPTSFTLPTQKDLVSLPLWW